MHDLTPPHAGTHDAATVHLCPQCRSLLAEVVRAQAAPPAPVPPPPQWQLALAWLDAHCGGRQAVLALGPRPLTGPPPDPPPGLDAVQVGQFHGIGTMLDAAGRRFFTPEFTLATRRGLAVVLAQRPGVLLDQRTGVAAHGVVWAVAKANGLLHPVGIVTDRSLREFFDSRQPGAGVGRKVQVAVRSLFPWREPELETWRWPINQATLEPLGQPDLLLASVRRRLIDVRERALNEAALALDG